MPPEIVPYPGNPAYGVTRDGEVFRIKPGTCTQIVPRKLALGTHPRGYLVARLGKRDRRYVHRMVAETFLPPPPQPGLQVLHRDGSRTNNRPENLRWGTPAQNSADMVAHGRSLRGRKHHQCRLAENDVRAIRRAAAGGATLTALADRYGVCFQNISLIKNRKSWAHLHDRA